MRKICKFLLVDKFIAEGLKKITINKNTNSKNLCL